MHSQANGILKASKALLKLPVQRTSFFSSQGNIPSITSAYKLPQQVFSHMDKAFTSIDNTLEHHRKEAKSYNKKLLVLIGEFHLSPCSLILETIGLSVGIKHNIKRLLVEMPPLALPLVYDYPTKGYVAPDTGLSGEMPPLGHLILQAKKSNLSIHALDSDNYQEMSIAHRDDYMAAQCTTHQSDDAVAIVGVGHLHGLITHPLVIEKYHPIGINASCVTPDEIRKAFRSVAVVGSGMGGWVVQYDPKLLETYSRKAEFTLTDSRILQLSMPSISDETILKAKDIISEVTHFCEKQCEEKKWTESEYMRI